MNYIFIEGLICGLIMGSLGYHYILSGFLQDPIQTNDVLQQQEIEQLFITNSSFMKQLKEDFQDPRRDGVKEFFVVPDSAIMNSSIPRLRYHLSDEHVLVLNTLERWGYIKKIPHDSLLYEAINLRSLQF